MNTTNEKVDRREKWELDKEWETSSKRTHIFSLPEFHHLEAKLLLIIFVLFLQCGNLWLKLLHTTRRDHGFMLWHQKNHTNKNGQKNNCQPERMLWERCYNSDK